MRLSSQANVPADSRFTVNVAASDPNSDPIRYNLMYSDKYISGGTGPSNVALTRTGNGQFTVTHPTTVPTGRTCTPPVRETAAVGLRPHCREWVGAALARIGEEVN
jgi:hypothetical protein